MTDIAKTRAEPIDQLFDIVGDIHAVMLGLDQPGQPMRPMAPQIDENRKTIWFYSKRDSVLGNTMTGKPNARARVCLVSKDHDYHAHISGILSEETRPEMIGKFWSPVIAAWFDEGKGDPNLLMLRFDPAEADIWASSDSALRFVWEIARANLSDHEPDLGETTHVVFPVHAPVSRAAE